MKRILYGKGGGLLTEICGLKIKAPLLEIDSNSIIYNPDHSFTICDEELGSISFIDQVTAIYQKWGKFGPYGDILSFSEIKLSDLKREYDLNFIARLAFHKPSLAVDLVPFIRDKKGDVFFFGIIRNNDPGKGKPAFIGGHRDIKGYHFEHVLEALCHESNDEAGFKIVSCPNTFIDSSLIRQGLIHLRNEVLLGGIQYEAILSWLGDYETTEEENLPNLGIKRVNQTTAITCAIEVDQEIDEKTIAGWLKAGDDAKEIFVQKVSDKNIPDFGIGHHKTIYRQAINSGIIWS